jgi:hypothetical protein
MLGACVVVGVSRCLRGQIVISRPRVEIPPFRINPLEGHRDPLQPVVAFLRDAGVELVDEAQTGTHALSGAILEPGPESAELAKGFGVYADSESGESGRHLAGGWCQAHLSLRLLQPACMPIWRYISVAVRRCSWASCCRLVCRWSLPRPRWQCAMSGRMPRGSASASALRY